MPDTPDFDQIALTVVNHPSRDENQLAEDVAEQLRLVWNARGAADERALKAELQRALDALIIQVRIEIDLEPLIKALDR
jgi:hypothetical protein